MKKSLLLIALVVVCCFVFNGHNDALAVDCDCYITTYDVDWIDPNNPSSGEHVVAWFSCNEENDVPIVTSMPYPWIFSGDIRNWMVWDGGNNIYQVFIHGGYYIKYHLLGWEDYEIIYSVGLN